MYIAHVHNCWRDPSKLVMISDSYPRFCFVVRGMLLCTLLHPSMPSLDLFFKNITEPKFISCSYIFCERVDDQALIIFTQWKFKLKPVWSSFYDHEISHFRITCTCSYSDELFMLIMLKISCNNLSVCTLWQYTFLSTVLTLCLSVWHY